MADLNYEHVGIFRNLCKFKAHSLGLKEGKAIPVYQAINAPTHPGPLNEVEGSLRSEPPRGSFL